MSNERKWFFMCISLVFIVGFLTGVLAAPTILHSLFRAPGIAGREFGGPGMEEPGMGGPDMAGPGMPEPGMGDDRQPGNGPMGKDKMRNFIIDDLSNRLSLTDSQKKKLKKIMDDNESEFLSTRKDIQKTFDEARKKMDAKILKILDDKQKAKFKEMTKHIDEENREHDRNNGDDR
jgi:Spy/CpxP family protein refolding chaperone